MFKSVVQYSRVRLIHTANVRKNHVNCPIMQIIRAYFTLRFYQWQRVVSKASMRIKQGVRISEDQIIWAILYMYVTIHPWQSQKLSQTKIIKAILYCSTIKMLLV